MSRLYPETAETHEHLTLAVQAVKNYIKTVIAAGRKFNVLPRAPKRRLMCTGRVKIKKGVAKNEMFNKLRDSSLYPAIRNILPL